VMQKTDAYIDSLGQVFAPNNYTVTTSNGPPIVNDFQMRNGSGALAPAFIQPFNPPTWAVPAPSNWDVQSNSTLVYWNAGGTGLGGDLAARKNNLLANAYAATVQEYLLGTNNNPVYTSNTHVKLTTNTPNGGLAPFDPVDLNNPQTNEG